jgi:mRNA turnover protein 4
MGLMLTNRSSQEIFEYFNKFQTKHYVRARSCVKNDIIVDEGSLNGFQHTMEPLLRFLDLTITLKKDIIHFLQPFTICSNGDILTSEQTKLLKLFQCLIAQFQIKVKVHWNKNNKQVQISA